MTEGGGEAKFSWCSLMAQPIGRLLWKASNGTATSRTTRQSLVTLLIPAEVTIA
jgi:hypothetical protein